MNPRDYFTDEQITNLEETIKQAELLTSGEIRIHIESGDGNPITRGEEVFVDLGMDKTSERNGILFYLALQTKRFAVLGDEGIHARVGQEFWNSIRDVMLEEFRFGRFVEGLTAGVISAGNSLQNYFPASPEDKNELPNTISFGP